EIHGLASHRLIWPKAEVNSRQRIHSYRNAGYLSDTDLISRSDSGCESSGTGVGMSCRTSGGASRVTEGPTAGDGTDTTGRYGSKTYSDTIVSRVRPSGRSKSQSSVDSYRHATRSGHTESISDSNSGIEWSTSDVSVTDRAYVSGTTITKGPAASDSTNTTGRCTSKAHRFPDLSRPRTSNRRNGKLRIYCYRDVSGRCHVDNISGSNTCCERSLAGVGVGRDASGA